MLDLRQLRVKDKTLVIDNNGHILTIDFYVHTVLALVISTQTMWKLGENKSGWSFFTPKGEAVTPYKKTPVEAIDYIYRLWPKDIAVALIEPA